MNEMVRANAFSISLGKYKFHSRSNKTHLLKAYYVRRRKVVHFVVYRAHGRVATNDPTIFCGTFFPVELFNSM